MQDSQPDLRQLEHSNIWIVVVTLNNYADTAECLGSLRRLTFHNYRVVLVDNGSTDGTPQRVRAEYPEVEVVENGRNLFVPGGFNVGFRYALARGADYAFMLNNDTTLDPPILDHLVAAGTRTGAGVLVPIVYYYNQPDRVWSSGARYRRFPPAIVFETRIFRDERSRRLDYAIGCGLLIGRRAFERVGLLDENIRFNWEDHDFARRVRDAGLAILQVPEARMWHKISRTSRPETPLFWEAHGESGAIFFRRHGRPVYLSMALHLGYFGLRELIFKRRGLFLGAFLRGVRLGLTRPLRPVPQI
jgi:hypothetical protein